MSTTPAFVNVVHIATYTPAETIELVSRIGARKGSMSPGKVFMSAVYGGMLLSFGSAASLIAITVPWFQDNAPGIPRLLGAIVFPLGLILVVLTGSDLFTASNMYTSVAALHRRLSISRMLLHWWLCFWGNLAGCLFIMAILFGYGGVFDAPPYKETIISFITKKQIMPQFHQIFLRGIGCNLLVCLACYLAVQGKDLTSKVVGIWWPIFGFVCLGFDHVVANMFFIPLGLWLHAPNLSIGLYVWKGIVPATLGNIIGGAWFCGAYLWWMHLFHEAAVKIDGVEYQEPEHRTEQGPVVSDRRRGIIV